MPWPVHPTGFFGAQGDNDSYRIERSLRFNSAEGATLDRTPSNSGNRTAWTQSFWIKRSKLGTEQHLFESGGANFQIFFDVNDCFRWYENGSYIAITTQVFRDTSAWYHFVLTWDSANATAGDRFRIYVNGVRVTSFSTTSNPSLNQSSGWNQASTAHYFGRYNASALYYFDGYLTEAYFIDGQALPPSSFGETDAITGRWKAKAYSGTYGTNGFYLKFADNSGTTATTLGKDSSGNGNNWTPNNFSVTAGAGNDSLLDSPTNNGTSGNYCTLNPLDNSATISNGNLDASCGTSTGALSTFSIPALDKWYWEVTVNTIGPSNGTLLGVLGVGQASGVRNLTIDGVRILVRNDGSILGNSVTYQTGLTSMSNGDILGVAYDATNGSIQFYRNGSTYGNSITIPSNTYSPYVGSTSNTSSFTVNFGQRPFAYTAPAGFKALCTTNLPTPTIRKPSSYMDVVTYTGNGSTQTISSLGFSPDLVWVKGRSQTSANHILTDSVRGNGKSLMSNNTNAEGTRGATLSSNGFSFTYPDEGGDANFNAATYVAWAWDEAPIAGMDIVSYTGNGTTQNVSHSLGVTPKMVIVKNRDTAATPWNVYHSGLTAGNLLSLNQTSAQFANTNRITAVSSSNFSVGSDSDVNQSTKNHIAYLFAEVEGFSKFGSYTGNGSADGPFVWCGFRPRWVMIKSVMSSTNWIMFDTARSTYNQINDHLGANTSSAENFTANESIDVTANGFKIRNTNTDINYSTYTHIFAAFAESAFKYSRAR